jgi:L-lysine 2,3-aminomutase
VGDKALKIAASEAAVLHKYLEKQRQISDLLVTGGDPWS